MDSLPEISLIPFTNKTMKAIEDLQEMLKCQICKKQPFSPQSMGRCDHFFCETCLSTLNENRCPICKIPSLPCERNPESIVRCLVSSCSDLVTLINGGKVEINTQGHEAPESTCSFTDSKVNINIDGSNIKEKNTTRVANTRNSSTNISSKRLNTSATPSKSVGSLDSGLKVRSQSRLSKTNLRKKNNVSLKSICQNEELESKTNITDLPIRPKKIACRSATKANSNSNIPDLKTLNLTLSSKAPEMRTPKQALNSMLAEIKTPVTPAIYKRNTKGETLLHSACIKGDLKKVNSLLSDGANPNTKDNAGWTPLHEACSHGFQEIALSLLQHGALVDVPGNDNGTPLHDAVTSGYVDLVCLLRKWGASDEIRDLSGRTPRSIADLCKSPKTLHKALDTKRDESLKYVAVLEPQQSKMVLMESNLSQDTKKKFEKVVKLLKLKAQEDFSNDVTHLIVGCNDNTKLCQRTIKYLMGVASGKWILTEKWLDECLAIGGPASPEEFEVLGSRSNPTSDAPFKARKNYFKMNPGLFKGCHIFLSGSFNDSFFNKKDLEALIKAGDGITLQREPNPESIPESEQTVPFHSDPKGPLGICSHYCIYQEGLNEPQLKYDMVHMKSLPLVWLLDCVDNWCLIPPFK